MQTLNRSCACVCVGLIVLLELPFYYFLFFKYFCFANTFPCSEEWGRWNCLILKEILYNFACEGLFLDFHVINNLIIFRQSSNFFIYLLSCNWLLTGSSFEVSNTMTLYFNQPSLNCYFKYMKAMYKYKKQGSFSYPSSPIWVFHLSPMPLITMIFKLLSHIF